MASYCTLAGSSTRTDDAVSFVRGIGATVVPGSRVDSTAATADAAALAAGRYRTVGTLTGPSVPAVVVDTLACRPAANSDRTSAAAPVVSPTTAIDGTVGPGASGRGDAGVALVEGPSTRALPSAAEVGG
jgi:hypothetical protein